MTEPRRRFTDSERTAVLARLMQRRIAELDARATRMVLTPAERHESDVLRELVRDWLLEGTN